MSNYNLNFTAAERKSERFQIALFEEEKDRLKKITNKLNVSAAEFLRQCINQVYQQYFEDG